MAMVGWNGGRAKTTSAWLGSPVNTGPPFGLQPVRNGTGLSWAKSCCSLRMLQVWGEDPPPLATADQV